ncbi:ATP-grasp domain-containing protein [Jatrophihabitans sp.]|uniref:ATP-grasp domain-containing protein n=1 Tax=Jatrophihabitans sp. TaxID=1932789 RepID=UPI0030C6F4D2|nr:hypothetical protein [Jatrophihabitans sp.]
MRVWFNRTFATTWHAITMIRANADGRSVEVIATHTDPTSPVLAAADVALPEPWHGDDDYLEWALRFAAEHRVEVFVPRERMALLATARADFAAVGTVLACPDADTVRLFEDKAAAYVAAARLGLLVPPHAVVGDAAGLRAAYDEFAALGGQVCMKPVSGVGGEGYRRLADRPPLASDFTGELRSVVRVADVCAAWAEQGPPAPMLVMPFLDGDEVSVDVLAEPDGSLLAAIGRLHAGGRRRVIVDDLQAREVAEVLTRAHRIGHLSNTQVRYWRGPADDIARPYLLEVNTRAAGGLFQTSLAGVNLPWLALKVALGEPVEPVVAKFGAAYTQLAAAVELGTGLAGPDRLATARDRPAVEERAHR